MFWAMGKHNGNPGLGTRMLSPTSQSADIELYMAPEQPNARTTSFTVKGASGVENFSTIAFLASNDPLDIVYPLQIGRAHV